MVCTVLINTCPHLAVASKKRMTKRNRKKKGRSNVDKGDPLLDSAGNDVKSTLDTRMVGVVITLANVFALAVFHYLANLPLHDPLLYGVQARFWLQPNMVVFLFSGCGYSFVLDKALAKRPKLSMLALPLSLAFVFLQIQRNFDRSDQSSNRYMEEYGRSLLETLPLNSLFLTNYDNQWTSIRYLQRCLGVRPDVIAINLSMMTYAWWGTYRQVYEEQTPLRIPPGRNRLVHTLSPVRRQAFRYIIGYGSVKRSSFVLFDNNCRRMRTVRGSI